jgi:hypothetical protein
MQCRRHPTYGGIYKPRTSCRTCKKIHKARLDFIDYMNRLFKIVSQKG